MCAIYWSFLVHCTLYIGHEEQEGPLIVRKLGAITTIGINRPEKCNAIDYKTANLLADAITHFEEDKSSLVAVLYGTGGNFCAGFDLKEMAESTENAERLTKLVRISLFWIIFVMRSNFVL